MATVMRALGRALALAALTACAGVQAGCARVHPWEREILAKPVMQVRADERENALQRTIDKASLEGVMGAGTSGSAGCGCN